MAGNREYFNRRLHSLLGVIPVGLFLTQHLVVNHFATEGEEAFNNAANFMGSLPFVIFLEIFVIYLPLLYHAIYGLYIAFTAKNNVSNFNVFPKLDVCSATCNRCYYTSSLLSWHVWETRIAAAFGAEVNFQMMEDILANPFMLWFYIIGVISAIFHFANGLWSFFVSWGITVITTITTNFYICDNGIFLVLSIVGVRALLAFV